jgi:hypothetical protein
MVKNKKFFEVPEKFKNIWKAGLMKILSNLR